MYNAPMSLDALELRDAWREQYRATSEALEIIRAQELAAMTEERARQIIGSLGAVEAWRDRPDWSGFVEQQALFHGLPRT